METQVRTPQAIFLLPQRLVVPLFQRPYVWDLANQWRPLWEDVTRLAERYLAAPTTRHEPHFLGAVVLQQVLKPIGHMQERMIIDGQQRLTTLQLLLDALHAELVRVGATSPPARLESLVTNEAPFRTCTEDRFKVWPTNRDRPAFNAIMGAIPPVDHDAIGFRGERMVEAHRYFSEQAREWLGSADPAVSQRRAAAIETVVRDLLVMVVIDLGADENAQEIFETLNARGATLTAADLVKNFVFQRLVEERADVEAVYESRWKEFETGFWETEIGAGRVRHPRSSLFLNHWLVSRLGEEVLARDVFVRFKGYANSVSRPMIDLLDQLHRSAIVYRQFVSSAASDGARIDRLALFGYRTEVLESEVIKPFVLWLLEPEEPPIPDDQLVKVLTRRLNSKVSNAGWTGVGGKQEALSNFDTLFLNRDIWRQSQQWTDDGIRRRSLELAELVTRIWPVPPGHTSAAVSDRAAPAPRGRRVGLDDLLNAGLLSPGMTLYPRQRALAGRTATLLPDGQIDVGGVTFATVNAAARAIAGKPVNGWWMLLAQQNPRRSLLDVWREYVERVAPDADDDEADVDDDADEQS